MLHVTASDHADVLFCLQVSSTTGSGSVILTSASSSSSNAARLHSRDGISLHSHHSHQQQHSHHHSSNRSSSSSSSGNPTTTSTPPLVLSLSQIQGGGGLLILNSSTGSNSTNPTHQSLVSPVAVTSFVCSTSSTHHQRSHHQNQHHANDSSNSATPTTIVLKQEAMETGASPSSCCHQASASESNTTSSSMLNININNNNSNININDSNKMDVTNGNISSGFDSNGATYLSSSREKNILRSATPKQQHVTLSSEPTSSMNSAPPTPAKHMDTSGEDLMDIKPTYCGSDTVLVISSSSNSGIKNTDTVSLVGGFFNETLDLSQEDIQRTLSANMPLSCSAELNHHRRSVGSMVTSAHHVIASKSMAPSSGDDMSPDDVIVPEINPMDFIDSCDVVVSPTQVCTLSKRILQSKSEDFL